MTKLALLLSTISVGALAQANLSGVYQNQPSHLWAKIDQQGNTFELDIRAPAGEQIIKATVGKEEQISVRGLPLTSSAEWDGPALVVHLRGSGAAGEFNITQRISLSADGNTVKFDAKQVAGGQENKSVTELVRRPANAWTKEAPVVAAEDAYKNVQALKGMSAAHMMEAMQRFTVALGVTCAHCHAEGHFESDEKSAKQTARKMIAMVHGIDTQNFPSSNEVTCWTCHRGSTRPESAKQQNKPQQ